MRTSVMLCTGALLLTVGGMARATVIGGLVFCAPAIDASGKPVTKCQNTSQGGGLDAPGSWQQPEAGWIEGEGVVVQSATYGINCGASFDNAFSPISDACDNAQTCNYTIDYRVLGDPAPGCAKNFTVTYSCPPYGPYNRHMASASAEAGFDKVVTLNCQ